MNHRSLLRALVRGMGVVAIAGLVATPACIEAQAARSASDTPTVHTFDPEARADAIVARVSSVQAGLGLTMVMGIYVRSGVVVAAGASRHGVSGRIDAFTRFHFDPFRESRWGPYAGGGLSTRFDRDEKTRAYLLVLMGLDGPVSGGMTPSLELGLGGGARLGVILRRAAAERR